MCPKMRSADYLNILNDQVIFHQLFFSSLKARAYSKMTMPVFIGLKLWKSGSGSMRHHFHTWIGHHRVQSQTLTPLRIFGMCWRRLCTAVRLSHHQYKKKWMQLWTGINVVTLQKRIGMMPRWMRAVIQVTDGPTKYYSVWLFLGQAVYIRSIIGIGQNFYTHKSLLNKCVCKQ